MVRTVALVLALTCAVPLGAQAGGAGTASTDVFAFGGSARTRALAAGVALPGDGGALIRNPASLADVRCLTVAADYRDWYLDTYAVHAGAALPSAWGGAFAVGVVRLSEGEVRDLIVEQSAYGEAFDNGSLGVAVGYGRAIPWWDGVDAGLSGLFLTRTLLGETARGFGLGGGVAAGLWRDALRLGASFRYVGDVEGDVEGISGVSPWNVTAGASVRIDQFLHPEASATVAADVIQERGLDAGGRVGLEVGFLDLLALRVGYDSTVEDAPVRFGVGVVGGRFDIDFVYTDHEALGPTRGFSLTFRAGADGPRAPSARSTDEP